MNPLSIQLDEEARAAGSKKTTKKLVCRCQVFDENHPILWNWK
jgi:hypothetical protein